MNNSISPPLPVWPTHWPSGSFKPWSTLLTALGAIIVGAVLLAISALVIIVTHGSGGRPSIVAFIAAQLVAEAGAVAILLTLLPRISGFSLAQLGFTAPRPRAVAIAVLGAIAMAIVADGGASLIQALTHAKHEQKAIEVFRQIHDPSAVAIFAGFAILLQPFIEETFFRIFIFNVGLRYGGFWAGAIASGVLFGAAHTDWYAFLPLACGGVILCYVYYRTRNAFASMITHALFNSLTVVALLYAPRLMN